jgi:protein SCO1/2
MRWIPVIPIVLAFMACAADNDTRSYELKGQVLSLEPAAKQILVKHEDIKGFMPAMTMPFLVDDVGELRGLTAGDLITATLIVEVNRGYLQSIKKTGSAPIPADAATDIPAAAGIDLLRLGDAVPDARLIDQDDRPITVKDLAGSAAVITFIYTRCPLPQYCPLMDRRFAEVQALVANDPELRGRVRLLSVSFDPAFDRAAVLRRHAATLKADPQVWTFATAEAAVVDRFAARFGVNVIREKDGSITHNLRTAVIDPAGRVTTLLDSNSWTVDGLIDELKAALAKR